MEGWGGETAISRSLRGKITWLLGLSQEMGRANCFALWDGSWRGKSLGWIFCQAKCTCFPGFVPWLTCAGNSPGN